MRGKERKAEAAMSALQSSLRGLEEVVRRDWGGTHKSSARSPQVSSQNSNQRKDVVGPTLKRIYEWEDDIDWVWPTEIDVDHSRFVITPIYGSSSRSTYTPSPDDNRQGTASDSHPPSPNIDERDLSACMKGVLNNPETPQTPEAYDVWLSGELKGTTSKITDAIELGLMSVYARDD